MDTKRIFRSIVVTLAAAATAVAQLAPRPENPLDRLNGMSDAEAVGFVNSVLTLGLPDGSQAGDLYSLLVGRSSLLLPIIEERIEELLRAPFPQDRYADKTASPEQVILFWSLEIAQAGNQQALREVSKLLKADDHRFDRMVERTLTSAITKGNDFTVAYQGLDIGDPAVDKRIIRWAEDLLTEDSNPSDEDTKHRWAAAMKEKYGVAPTEKDWGRDPIASRLKPGTAESLRRDVLQFAAEARKTRTRK